MSEATSTDLQVGGFEPFSLCDWPGKIVATIFCQGCPWRCPYCHNPALCEAGVETDFSFQEILAFLETRRGLLDGVLFSGGEPTLQKALIPAIKAVRAMGFKVGIHSAGVYPEHLKEALPLTDWIGLDFKAPYGAYERMTGAPKSGKRAFKSLRYVLASGIDYEVRTTVHPGLLSDMELGLLDNELTALGAHSHKIQAFRPTGVDQLRLAEGLKVAAR